MFMCEFHVAIKKNYIHMKTQNSKSFLPAFWLVILLFSASAFAFSAEPFIEFRGTVVDKTTRTPLAFAGISVAGTNMTTVTNTEGEFSLKILTSVAQPKIKVQYIGFISETVTVEELTKNKNRIELTPRTVELPEVSVISIDAEELMRSVFEKVSDNYATNTTQMTAFYRETIKNNSSYVSLSEAVLDVLKEPAGSYKNDVARFYKARKKVDYNKLDTLIFKLMGGPYNSLNLDVIKHPEYVFTEDVFKNYVFTFEKSTHLDNQLIYIINFTQNSSVPDPYYRGKIYVDAKSLAIKSVVFSLNLDNKEAAASLFIVKKPLNARVVPVVADYRIDYAEKDGKWYYNYSRIELALKIIWKKKLFHTTYHSTIEMAVTDWNLPDDPKAFRHGERLKPNVIVSDEPIGFKDPEFWGDFNVIEPEKSIETAIKKIKKQMEK